MDKQRELSRAQHCTLLEVSPSSYYHFAGQTDKQVEDELLMRELDKIYLEEPT